MHNRWCNTISDAADAIACHARGRRRASGNQSPAGRSHALRRLALFAVGVGLLIASGCSGKPDPPDQPEFDAGRAGTEAIKLYDANRDGRLDAQELEKCPALLQAVDRADANGDGALTADEITARIEAWFASGTVIMDWPVYVELNGKPLEGATVVFEPEAFLGSGFTVCRGVTDKFGQASLRGANAQFPGLYVGAYRVRISKKSGGKETIPARYNTESELGFEVADDIPEVHSLIEFHLTSR